MVTFKRSFSAVRNPVTTVNDGYFKCWMLQSTVANVSLNCNKSVIFMVIIIMNLLVH